MSEAGQPARADPLRTAEDGLRAYEAAGQFGLFEADQGGDRWSFSADVPALFGLAEGEPFGSREFEKVVFADDLPKLRDCLGTAGEAKPFACEFRVRPAVGPPRWFVARGSVDPATRRVRGSFHDITERKSLDVRLLAANETLEARIAELRDETHTLAVLNQMGMRVAAELDLERLVQAVTDAGVELSGAEFGAFFYNLIDEHGESYTLYALSGAPRSAFEKFPMPRNTAIFEPTFRGRGVVRSADILADPRYGRNAPHRGMPEGHLPVRSYLAVPVVSRSGEVLGGLFFGHPNPGVFTERAERLVSGIAAQAAVAIDNARLYEGLQRELKAKEVAEESLRALNESLEQRVVERARELAASTAQLAANEQQFRHVVESVSDYAIYMLDPDGRIASWNLGAERIKGYSRGEIVGQHFSRFFTEEDRRAGLPDRVLEAAARTGKFESEGKRVRKDGTTFWASATVNAIRDGGGRLIGFAKITRDLTERRAAEERLRQAQKMEGIGQLTGGVAHDFNNLLTVIIGNLEALQRHLAEPRQDVARLQRSADNAMRGARRAESLTQHLLAFSRQQPLEPRAVDANRVVTGMSDLLRRTIGEQIVIETSLGGGLWRAFADPNQLEVALINLAVNARDAMPHGGRLTVETANVYLDEAYAATQAELVPGQYVMIAVTDNGTGMSQEVREKAFEPFYTTKGIGHGTGLGLSQVYGFVKQSQGHVKIYSEVGEGTTVKLYLPRFHSDDPVEVEDTRPQTVGGTQDETILVVEDDADVRAYTCETLRELGYSVIEVPNGPAALRALESHPEIAVLFTDVGLPGMNGRELADAARRLRPRLKVLFTSGYARNAMVHEGRLDPGVELITKPFTQAALAARLRDIIDARSATGRVLIVEDEPLLQMLARQYVEEFGLKADVAGSATAAMGKLRLVPGGVDAVLIDVGLPDRTGDVLVREIRALFPALPIVLTTGAPIAELKRQFADDRNIAYAGKPYTIDKIRGALATLGFKV